jgi:hypothetical protein
VSNAQRIAGIGQIARGGEGGSPLTLKTKGNGLCGGILRLCQYHVEFLLSECLDETAGDRDIPIPPRVPLTAGKPIYRPYSVPSPSSSLDLPLPLSSADGCSAGESPLEEEGRVLLLERRVDMGCSCKNFQGNEQVFELGGLQAREVGTGTASRHSGNARVLGCSRRSETVQISI